MLKSNNIALRQLRIIAQSIIIPMTTDDVSQTDATTSPNPDVTKSGNPSDPGVDQVYRYLMFGLSLPERAVRSTAAMVSGAINESASLLVPQAFQDSKTYRTFVKQMLDLMANDVGGVTKKNEGDASSQSQTTAQVENYVAKKTVGTFVDFAGMATMHVSPLTVLALVSDLAYGTKTYLNELSDELKREGVIDQDSTINGAADLLNAIGSASSQATDAFDMPPVNVEELRKTIEKTRQSVSQVDPTKLIPQSEIDQLWRDMQAMAQRDGVNLFKISSAMSMYALGKFNTAGQGALTTLRVTGNMVDRHLFDHYRDGLKEISDRGLYAMLADSSQPYLDAVWYNFSTDRPTVTEDVVSGKMIGKVWRGIKGWFSRKDSQAEK